MATRRYTSEQISAMCAAPWQWAEQLRAEAKRRKLPVTSVTPIADVVTALRATKG